MSMAEPIRILIVDDHMVVRAGLAQVINAAEDMTVVAEAASGEEALLQCHQHQPALVLMDMMMRGMGGQGATEVITRYHPATRILVLTTFGDLKAQERMLAAGARGFLSKTASVVDLLTAIRRVHAGEIVCDAGGEPDIQPEPAAVPAEPGLGVELGAQQRRALALLTKGYTNNEIASYMGISLPTARYHVSAILLKLGVSNRAEAAALAARHKLVSDIDF